MSPDFSRVGTDLWGTVNFENSIMRILMEVSLSQKIFSVLYYVTPQLLFLALNFVSLLAVYYF